MPSFTAKHFRIEIALSNTVFYFGVPIVLFILMNLILLKIISDYTFNQLWVNSTFGSFSKTVVCQHTSCITSKILFLSFNILQLIAAQIDRIMSLFASESYVGAFEKQNQ